ncbi:MAG: hypothetical protein QOK39_984 [Acidimicrobiaceae bacterium]|nr:hypothetical protein [Acidimicrobiaceae bacterium]
MLVALGVIFATLLVLAFTMFSSFAAVGFSRQRTEASALANQTIEQIRALPHDMLFMSQTDLAAGGDSQVVACTAPAGSYCFLTASGRQIPTATFGTATTASPFFNPAVHSPATAPDHFAHHTGQPGITDYTVKSYVTLDPTDPLTRIVTVQVNWTQSQVGGVKPNVQVESKIYTSPFSENSPGATTTTTVAPNHGWTANAQSLPGTITVSGTVLNLNAANVQFNLPTATSYLSGSTAAGGTSTGPAGHLVTAGTASSGISAANLSIINTPGAIATATSPIGSATNGPNTVSATPGLLNSLPGSVNQCTVLLVCTLIGGTMNAQVSAGSVTTGAAVAASSAGGTANVPSGVIPTTPGLGYGKAAATQTGPISSNLGLNVAGVPLLNLGLVNLVPTGNANPDTATVAQNGSSGVPLGQTYTASATKSFTELDVLSGLPVVGTLIKISGFQASASACAGPGSCAAATASQQGSIAIAGIVNPISLVSAVPITVPPVNVSTGILNIAVTATVAIGSATTTGTNSASVTSPVSINVHLGISTLLGTLVDVNVVVNLGSVTTSASYS